MEDFESQEQYCQINTEADWGPMELWTGVMCCVEAVLEMMQAAEF